MTKKDSYTAQERAEYNKEYRARKIAEDPYWYLRKSSEKSQRYYADNREMCLAKANARYARDKDKINANKKIQRKIKSNKKIEDKRLYNLNK